MVKATPTNNNGKENVMKMTTAKCGYEHCDRNKEIKGLCRAHYSQVRRGQELSPLRGYNKNNQASESGRVCTKCKKHKSWDEFYTQKAGYNGHTSQCKGCVKARVNNKIKG